MRLLAVALATAWLAALAAAAEESCTIPEAKAGEPCGEFEARKRVQLQQGLVEGARLEAEDGSFFYSFKNIPFAKPPVGDLRFKEPQPAEAWTGVRNGSLPVPKCPQFSISTFQGKEIQVEGDEDCLRLSVFTPRPYASDLPVMVWIHGGGFVIGGAEEYQPSPLMTRDVVVVVIQYRLGTLGFLSTEDSELPGNLGLQDQTLALRWVKDNIHDLGGDPDKVTIFGESAGGASVHFHVLSPMSAGLFSRAIMQSGTMLCPWATRDGHRDVAARLAGILGCSGVPLEPFLDSAALLACLRGVSAEALVDVQREFYIWASSPQVMLPRVDGAFLPDHPATLLREGRYNKVDIISGVTSHEGALFTTMILGDADLSERLLKNLSVTGPLGLGVDQEEDPEYLARRAYHHYLGSPLTMEKAEAFTQLMTDRMFVMCHLDVVKHHQREEVFGTRVFTYELQHRAEFAFLEMFFGPSEVGKEWVGHADDIQYLFDPISENFTLGREEDLLVKRIMLDLWTSFAATGHPTPDLALGFGWEPTTNDRDAYLAITPAPDMKAFSNHDTQRFWRNMPTAANKLMYPQRFSRCLG